MKAALTSFVVLFAAFYIWMDLVHTARATKNVAHLHRYSLSPRHPWRASVIRDALVASGGALMLLWLW